MTYDPQNPYLSVTVGTMVYTADNRRLGPVSEIRGRYFKIGRPWWQVWQRAYWLRTDSVRSSVPGDRVVLNVEWAQLDERKIVDPPERA
jgi:hypothetical protein